MDDPTFLRGPVTAPPPAARQDTGASALTETSAQPEDLPPSLRVEAKRRPLAADLLCAGDLYETFSVRSLSEEVDSFVNAELRRQGRDDTPEAYRDLLKELTRKLSIPDDLVIYEKLEKLSRWCRIHLKLLKATSEREELLAADPLSLSPARFRKYMNLSA